VFASVRALRPVLLSLVEPDTVFVEIDGSTAEAGDLSRSYAAFSSFSCLSSALCRRRLLTSLMAAAAAAQSFRWCKTLRRSAKHKVRCVKISLYYQFYVSAIELAQLNT